jgi:hypothetical protein
VGDRGGLVQSRVSKNCLLSRNAKIRRLESDYGTTTFGEGAGTDRLSFVVEAYMNSPGEPRSREVASAIGPRLSAIRTERI